MLNTQIHFRNLLNKHYSEMMRKNASYSMRAFSKKVGVHSGALSEIFSGKRKVSRKLAERVAVRLGLDPQERSEALKEFKVEIKKEELEKELEYLKISAAQFKVISDWEHLAILSLVKTKNFNSSLSFISERLGISESRAQSAVQRLLTLDLLRMSEDGILTRTKEAIRTTDDVPSEALQNYYRQTLDLAKDSIHECDVKDRDLTSMTVKMDKKSLSMAKELIRKFQDEFSKIVEQSSTPTEVFLLSMQLFPLTKELKKEKEV